MNKSKTENIHSFLEGLKSKSVESMPLSESAVLITPLAQAGYLKGIQSIHQFMREKIFPMFSPDDYEVIRHVENGERIVTLWDAIYEQTGVKVPVVDYFEFDKNATIMKIKPFFDTIQLNKAVVGRYE